MNAAKEVAMDNEQTTTTFNRTRPAEAALVRSVARER